MTISYNLPPSGQASGFIADPWYWYTLRDIISGINANIVLNYAGEGYGDRFNSYTAIADFIKNGGVYVDYCGWPLYWTNTFGTGPLFGIFLEEGFGLSRTDQYCNGFFATSCEHLGYPFSRGWLSPFMFPASNSVIVAPSDAPHKACGANFVYSVVGVKAGSGWYFYGVGQHNPDPSIPGSVSPYIYGNFIKNCLAGSVNPPNPPKPPPPDNNVLQAECLKQPYSRWVNGQCVSDNPNIVNCINAGGFWLNNSCVYPGDNINPVVAPWKQFIVPFLAISGSAVLLWYAYKKFVE